MAVVAVEWYSNRDDDSHRFGLVRFRTNNAVYAIDLRSHQSVWSYPLVGSYVRMGDLTLSEGKLYIPEMPTVTGGASATLIALTFTPEPSTLVLLGIGAISLLGYGWRRRRKLYNLSPMILAAMVVLAVTPARADVFNMPAGQTSLQLVTVGDPGNAADTAVMAREWHDTTGYGSVPYVYNIGKYDVTVGQYCQFLNAVAKTDTYGLYIGYMASPGRQ